RLSIDTMKHDRDTVFLPACLELLLWLSSMMDGNRVTPGQCNTPNKCLKSLDKGTKAHE
ncbi:hypothetical protein STEG23_007802, partial [Scotinomys teguina]